MPHSEMGRLIERRDEGGGFILEQHPLTVQVFDSPEEGLPGFSDQVEGRLKSSLCRPLHGCSAAVPLGGKVAVVVPGAKEIEIAHGERVGVEGEVDSVGFGDSLFHSRRHYQGQDSCSFSETILTGTGS